jgi:putative two-component system response regulator
MGMPSDFVQKIRISSQLHDIGKIGITDDILLKPGSLTSEELDIVKTHTTEGGKLLAGSFHPVIQMAESISLNHHERWDGTGYPAGSKMEDIPLEGRIVMIADQYDVIRTRKPYKSALGHEEAFKIITKGNERTSPKHFDPRVLDAFIELSPKLDALYDSY